MRKYISKVRKNQKEVFIPIDHPIGNLFNEEKEHLSKLPEFPFDCCKSISVKVDSCSRVQFET
ncbi:MAG: hypothetical protein P9M03_05750, partial [Candidatus Theseobacter exili]|nr:hypothetical protein [Candidatus Theseobacter exili]